MNGNGGAAIGSGKPTARSSYYPENWLIESQRSNRTEIYQKLEQEVRQGQATADYLETVLLNYIDGLDTIAHLQVTGTCEDPATGDIYVVARTLADPPVFYLRSYVTGAWNGWTKIPLDIKAHRAIPSLSRTRVSLLGAGGRIERATTASTCRATVIERAQPGF